MQPSYLGHLDRLESESIEIHREAIAEGERPPTFESMFN